MASRKNQSDKKIQELRKRNHQSGRADKKQPSGTNPFSKVDPQNLEVQPETKNTEVEFLKRENEELKDKNTRLLADMQNVMRQHDMDVAQAKKSTKKEISLSFIDFVSNMNLAFSFAPKNPDPSTESFLSSLRSSLEKSLQSLKNYNIEMILPEAGTPFDPEVMTAINEPTDKNEHPNIKGVVSAGLRIEGQVIKPVTITF